MPISRLAECISETKKDLANSFVPAPLVGNPAVQLTYSKQHYESPAIQSSLSPEWNFGVVLYVQWREIVTRSVTS